MDQRIWNNIDKSNNINNDNAIQIQVSMHLRGGMKDSTEEGKDNNNKERSIDSSHVISQPAPCRAAELHQGAGRGTIPYTWTRGEHTECAVPAQVIPKGDGEVQSATHAHSEAHNPTLTHTKSQLLRYRHIPITDSTHTDIKTWSTCISTHSSSLRPSGHGVAGQPRDRDNNQHSDQRKHRSTRSVETERILPYRGHTAQG